MSNASPFLSIIVPVYNVEKYLKRCLDSILGQSFCDFELICVDDGSLDCSLNILKEYSEKDERVKVISKKNGGLSSARNVGLDIAIGKWILFVDSDDLLGCGGNTHFDELARLCEMASDDVDWVVAQSTVFYEDGYKFKNIDGDLTYFKLPEKGVYDNFKLKNIPMNVCAWGKLYKRSVIECYKLRFPNGLRYEDEYWYSCYLYISQRVKVVEVNLYSYLRRNDGIMGDSFIKRDLFKADDRLKILEKVISFYKKFDLTREDEKFLADRFLGLYRSAVESCPVEDRLYIYWHAGKILRDFNIDCQGYHILQTLKQGKVEPKQTRLSKFRNSIRKRIGKLSKLVGR